MGFKQWGAALTAVLALAGCWSAGESAFRAADYEARRINTIAVLPVLNQAEWAPETSHLQMQTSLVDHLRREKHYAVTPPEAVATALNGPGLALYHRYTQALNRSEPPAPAVLAGLAQALGADAVMQQTVLSFHQMQEQGTGATIQGGARLQTIPVSVIQVRGELWGSRGQLLWRQEHFERVLHEPAALGRANIAPVVQQATRGLLASLPANTWAPVTPAPSPTPRPLITIAPFPDPRLNR